MKVNLESKVVIVPVSPKKKRGLRASRSDGPSGDLDIFVEGERLHVSDGDREGDWAKARRTGQVPKLAKSCRVDPIRAGGSSPVGVCPPLM
ncbi:hypothetical protein FCV25MIE_21050 [Fagus crenata]